MIVAPLSILGVWEEEFQKFAAFPYALAVLSGSSAKKLDTLRHMIGTALQVVVVNYESAWRLEKALTAWHPDLIIADEGHKIKTHNIAASKASILEVSPCYFSCDINRHILTCQKKPLRCKGLFRL